VGVAYRGGAGRRMPRVHARVMARARLGSIVAPMSTPTWPTSTPVGRGRYGTVPAETAGADGAAISPVTKAMPRRGHALSLQVAQPSIADPVSMGRQCSVSDDGWSKCLELFRDLVIRRQDRVDGCGLTI
jgi:hypothetical protein